MFKSGISCILNGIGLDVCETVVLKPMSSCHFELRESFQDSTRGRSMPFERDCRMPADELLGRTWLSKLGFDQVTVTEKLDMAVLSEALFCIQKEPSTHLWKNFQCARHILDFENSLRETRFFTYHADIKGQNFALGLGTVATSLSRDFQDEGFPVIARAFVFPKFRRMGLHALMLQHRVQWCQKENGQSLCAVHLGTNQPIVEASALKMGFKQMGIQKLTIDGGHVAVKAFLLPSERFKKELSQDREKELFERKIRGESCSGDFSPGPSAYGRLYEFGRAIPLEKWDLKFN